jgi:ATP-dependent protease HslVU (ClpYQ) peptidase subunit
MSDRLERAKAYYKELFDEFDIEANGKVLTDFADAEVAEADAKLAKVREEVEKWKDWRTNSPYLPHEAEDLVSDLREQILEILDGSEGR